MNHDKYLVSMPLKKNLATTYANTFDAESEITITANQTAPSVLDISDSVSYSESEGLHSIDIPTIQYGSI
jgi:hypothetical protein